jgi:hypothetical protein
MLCTTNPNRHLHESRSRDLFLLPFPDNVQANGRRSRSQAVTRRPGNNFAVSEECDLLLPDRQGELAGTFARHREHPRLFRKGEGVHREGEEQQVDAESHEIFRCLTESLMEFLVCLDAGVKIPFTAFPFHHPFHVFCSF